MVGGPWWLPGLVALVCLGGSTLGLAQWLESRTALERQRRFQRDSEHLVLAVKTRLSHYSDSLRAAQGLFVRQPLPTRSEWSQFVNGLALPSRYPGVRSMAWIPRVTTAGLAAFEKAMQAQGHAAFRVWDLASGPGGSLRSADEFHPIAFISPEQPSAIGFDTGSRPRFLKESIAPMRDNNEVILGGKFQPVEAPNDPSFGVTLPVYGLDRPPISLAERRDSYLGHLSCLISAQRFFKDLNAHSSLRIAIYDDSEEGVGTQLWESEGADRAPSATRLEAKQDCELYGRRWVFKFTATPVWMAQNGGPSAAWILGWGAFLSVAGAAALGWLGWARAQAESQLKALPGQFQSLSETLNLEAQARKSAEKARGTLVSLVSRELRPSLTELRSGIRLLETSGGLRQDQTEYLGVATRNLERMVRSLDNLVDQEALAKGDLTLELGPVALGKLLREVQAAVQPQAEAHRLTCHLDAPEAIRVRGDAFRLRQALTSLLSQAVDQAPPGGELWIWIDAPSEGRVRTSIHDPSRDAGKVEGGRDANLNLMHAKAVVQAMGGRFGSVDVEKGHTLWIELPLV